MPQSKRALLPEKPSTPKTKLPSDPNSIEAQILDFLGGATGLPMGDSETTAGSLGEIGGLLGPAAGVTILKGGLPNKLRAIANDLPTSIQQLLGAYTGTTGPAGINYRNMAVKAMYQRPELIGDVQDKVADLIGPEFPVFRGTSSVGRQGAKEYGARPFHDPDVERVRSFSLSPKVSHDQFARPLHPAMEGELKGATASASDVILPGYPDEFELLLDQKGLKNTRRKKLSYAPYDPRVKSVGVIDVGDIPDIGPLGPKPSEMTLDEIRAFAQKWAGPQGASKAELQNWFQKKVGKPLIIK